MSQGSLFGGSSRKLTWEEKYRQVLSSKRWKTLRESRISKTGRRCEVCRSRVPEWSQGVRLELHHKDYKNLGNETDSDVVLVCTICHKREDAKRELATKRRSQQRYYEARFEGWASKVYGDDYQIAEPWMYDEFDEWLDSLEE